MDHKDLLNDVINGMNRGTDDNMNNDMASIEDGTGVELKLSVGEIRDDSTFVNETYIMDVRSYDWEGSRMLVGQMDNNMDSIRSIMNCLVNEAYGNGSGNKDVDNAADCAIGIFSDFLKKYNIDIDYKTYFKVGDKSETSEQMRKMGIAMLMGMDCLSIIHTIKDNTTTYAAMQLMNEAFTSFNDIMNDTIDDTNNDDTGLDNDGIDIDDEKKVYNVIGRYKKTKNDDDEDVMKFDKVLRVEETEYISPDEMYMLEYDSFDENEGIATCSGVIMGNNLDDAMKVAEEFFISNEEDIPVPGHEKDAVANNKPVDWGIDDHSVSGLIDE